jgi:hypothetical protein
MNRSRRIMGLDLIVFIVLACTMLYMHVFTVPACTILYMHVHAPNGLIISIVPSTVEKHTSCQDFGDVSICQWMFSCKK